MVGVRYMCACAVDIGLEYALIRIGCCVDLVRALQL